MNQTEQAIRQALTLLHEGKAHEAEHLFCQVLASPPPDPASLGLLGVIAQRFALHGYAVTFIGGAIELSPDAAEYHYNLSISLAALGKHADAESALNRAIAIKPALAEAHTNLGGLLAQRGDSAGALASFERASLLRPDDPLGHLNIGKILRGQDRLDEAEARFRTAIRIAPALAAAWNMLGSCLRESGRIDQAVGAFTRATQLDPALREAASNLCYALYFDPAANPQQILESHRDWARRFAVPPPVAAPSVNVDRSPNRRLRVGYVSPNFRSHAVGSFVHPIFQNHDRARFEVIAYSDTVNHDQMTAALRSASDQWRDTAWLPDPNLAELIRSDRIDILIDLTLHMRGCRLGVFAHRPAPVQLTHLAYCGTSGLSQMDGCICDVHMAAGNDPFFVERLLPLSRSYWCYMPPAIAPDVGRLPASLNGYVTFGSLNSLAKVNDRVIEDWARILSGMPQSRLVVFTPGVELNPSILARFEKHGIPAARIEPVGRKPYREYFEGFKQIDIALDPFPYNGGTTTLDALWMGAPVLTLAGKLPVGRAGVSILTNLGLEDWIASSEDDYVRRGIELASHLEALAVLRSQLRGRMAGSSLVDGPRYVRELEALYLGTWRDKQSAQTLR